MPTFVNAYEPQGLALCRLFRELCWMREFGILRRSSVLVAPGSHRSDPKGIYKQSLCEYPVRYPTIFPGYSRTDHRPEHGTIQTGRSSSDGVQPVLDGDR